MTVDPFEGVDVGLLPPAAEALFVIARTQSRQPVQGQERRLTPRFYIAVEGVARSLGADGLAVGEAFRAVIADVSNGGLRLLHGSSLATPFLAVRIGLEADSVTVIVRVIRSGDRQTYFEHAGPYHTPIDTDRLRDRIFELAGV